MYLTCVITGDGTCYNWDQNENKKEMLSKNKMCHILGWLKKHVLFKSK
jgi:hypothetical protein